MKILWYKRLIQNLERKMDILEIEIQNLQIDAEIAALYYPHTYDWVRFNSKVEELKQQLNEIEAQMVIGTL